MLSRSKGIWSWLHLPQKTSGFLLHSLEGLGLFPWSTLEESDLDLQFLLNGLDWKRRSVNQWLLKSAHYQTHPSSLNSCHVWPPKMQTCGLETLTRKVWNRKKNELFSPKNATKGNKFQFTANTLEPSSFNKPQGKQLMLCRCLCVCVWHLALIFYVGSQDSAFSGWGLVLLEKQKRQKKTNTARNPLLGRSIRPPECNTYLLYDTVWLYVNVDNARHAWQTVLDLFQKPMLFRSCLKRTQRILKPAVRHPHQAIWVIGVKALPFYDPAVPIA